MNNLTKILVTGAIATLLLPTLALAHEGSVKSNNTLQLRIEKGILRAEKVDSSDQHHEDRKIKHAITTAAAITKAGVRIQTAANTILSFNDRVGVLIADADADMKAALEAKFTAVKVGAANAKVEAGNAISGAAQVSASNSTTTNAALLAQAKVDLKESKGFLQDTKKLFMQILRSLWN